MDALLQDVRFALRGLRGSPGFTLAAVLCLALGIGANTAVFSVLHGVLLRPLPFEDPERLVLIWGRNLSQDLPEMPSSGAEFLDYRDRSTSFTDVAAVINRYINLTGSGVPPERLVAARVSASLFPLLGVEAAHGRTFLAEEDRLGNENVVLLSHGLWRRRFGGDPGIVGQKLLLSEEPYEVVGVLPPEFRFKVGMFDYDIFIPVAINLEKLPPRDFRGLTVVARLKPGVALERAQSEMDALAARFRAEYPEIYAAGGQGPGAGEGGWGIHLVPLHEQMVGDIRPALALLMGTVGLVLLIACANVANLLLARATARQKEVSIRAALGASRGGLLRQFLTESVLLGLLGGALGLLLAYWGLKGLVLLNPGDIPRLDEVRIAPAVLGFTALVSLLTGLLFGLVPAVKAFKPDLQATLKEGGKTSGQGGGSDRVRGALVVAEVAIALVVLAGAGLLMRSLWRLQEVDLGFRTERVLTLQLYLSPTRYGDPAARAAYIQRLVESLRRVPGVEAAGAVSGLPLSEVQALIDAVPEGLVLRAGEASPVVDWRPAGPDYFRAMGIPLRQGRAFTDSDHAQAAPVAIVDESYARRYWPGQSALGRRVRVATNQPGAEAWRTVVGVTGTVRALGLEGEAREQVYTPIAQSPSAYVAVALRTRVPPESVAGSVRQAIWSVDPDQPVEKVMPMADIVADSSAGRRSYAFLLGVFAAVALLLAAIGVYGIMAYSVAQRHQEIGIRMALGARPADVLGMIVRQGMKLAALGLLFGGLLYFASRRWVEGLLYGVAATDVATLLGVALLLAGVILLASYVPARRASRVNPMVTFRA